MYLWKSKIWMIFLVENLKFITGKPCILFGISSNIYTITSVYRKTMTAQISHAASLQQ